MDADPLVAPVTTWFARRARPLPWRSTDPWGVLVSEFMLQQTQVDRVLPYWQAWMDRWPTPQDLAGAPLAEALRMWGRLGYPRRAQRLHQCALLIVERHGGRVPREEAELRALPGIGEYTCAAIRAFAFGIPGPVLDTNVRRVLARSVLGTDMPRPSPSAAERALAARLASDDPAWPAAAMELGALVCTSRRPLCEECPIEEQCAWRAAGSPGSDRPARPKPRFEGSDRQARGAIMASLRADSPIEEAWVDAHQRARALAGLIDDGLVEPDPAGGYRLAGG